MTDGGTSVVRSASVVCRSCVTRVIGTSSRFRHRNERESFASRLFKFLEERSTVNLETRVHKVSLLLELMRSAEGT